MMNSILLKQKMQSLRTLMQRILQGIGLITEKTPTEKYLEKQIGALAYQIAMPIPHGAIYDEMLKKNMSSAEYIWRD